jgi:hypothetical protein
MPMRVILRHAFDLGKINYKEMEGGCQVLFPITRCEDDTEIEKWLEPAQDRVPYAIASGYTTLQETGFPTVDIYLSGPTVYIITFTHDVIKCYLILIII